MKKTSNKMPASKPIFTVPDRASLKTYSHLSNNKRMPSEYELVTSQMLYYAEKGGFEVHTPISEWYEQYQKNSLGKVTARTSSRACEGSPESAGEPSQARDDVCEVGGQLLIKLTTLDQFVDPEQMTYAAYIKRQKEKEISLDASFKLIDDTGYDKALKAEWVSILSQVIAPLRYPWHGLQMITSYLGSMAPESKLVIVFAFQTMDEIRRIQRIAYRMRSLQLTYPDFGVNSLVEWQTGPLWQPLRRAIERLLVTYDWLEGFVALNLCFKPILDKLLLIHFANIAKKQGDPQLEILFHSFWEDASWQQAWSKQLLLLILKENSQNKTVIEGWLSKWLAELLPAVRALKPIFGDNFDKASETVLTEWVQELAPQIKVPV